MPIQIQRYLEFTLTQGSTDAFIQGSADTEIVPENGYAYKVVGANFAITSALFGVSSDLFMAWSFTRDTKASLAYLDDPDTMLWDARSIALVSSGMAVIPQQFQYADLVGLYIVEPTVYAGFVTNGASGALSAYARLYYEEVKLSEVEILRILNNS